MESKFSKINHKFFQTGGRAPGAPALDPPLDQMIFTRITHIYIYIYIYKTIYSVGRIYKKPVSFYRCIQKLIIFILTVFGIYK